MVEPDFKALFESLPGLYMVLDPNLQVVAATDAYLQATMTRRADIVGRHVFEVFPDNSDDPSADAIRNSRASFNRVLQTRSADAMVVQRHDVRKPASEGDGFEVRYWSPVNSPVLNADGSLAYIIHRVENVTEFVLAKQQAAEPAKLTAAEGVSSVQAEADLYSRSREVAETSLRLKQANEGLSDDLANRAEELQAILDAAPVAVWIAHDPQCLRITGNAYADQLVMQTGRRGNVSRSAPPGDEAVSYRVFRNGVELRPEELPAQIAAATGQPVKEGEFELVFADGRTVHMLMGAVPLYDGEGRVRGSVAAGVDITKRNRAEAERDRLFDYSLDILCIVGFDGRFKRVNPSFERILGWKEEETLSRTMYEFIHPDDLERSVKAAKAHESGHPAIRFENRYRCSDGSYRWISWNSHPVVEEGLIIGVGRDITELKRTKDALGESEERFRSVVENMSEGLLLFDAQGNFTYQNSASLRIHGFGNSEAGRVEEENLPATWRGWDETGHPMSFEEWPISRVLRGERFQNQTLRAMRVETGQEFYASYNGCPIVDSNGRLTFGFITIREITDQRKAEMSLRESEERLRLALAATELGAWDYDPVTGALVWDARCKELFGLPPDIEVNYDMFLAGLHPDDRERANQVVQRTFDPASDGLFDIEYRTVGLRDGGVVRWVHATGRALFNNAGQAIRFIGTVQDITGRKRAEEALRLTQASVDGAAEMVAWFTPNGRVHYANDATCRTLGYSREELVQMSAMDFSPGFTWDQYQQHWEEVRKRKSFTLEVTHRRKDGAEYPAEVLVNHVVHGGQEYIFAYGRDITERKRVEEALRRSESEQRLQREFLATLLSNAPCGISVLKGRDFRYEMVNPAYQTMVGPDVALIGRAYREVFPEAAAAGAESRLRRVIETGEPWIVSRFRAPVPGKPNAIWDGQVVRLAAVVGDEPSILGTVWDVTEQVAADDALRRHAQLLKLSFDAIIVWCLDGGIESWNVGAERLYGFSESEALGRVTDELLMTVRPKRWDQIKTEIRDRGSWEGELRHRVRDGREIIVSARLQLFRDGEGIEHVLETDRDITDRKRAEEALAASEGRFRALLESAPLAIVAINESGRILLVNGTTEALFGSSRTELLGESVELLLPEPLRDGHTGHLVSYFTNPRNRPMGLGQDLRARKKDGTSMPVEVSLSFVEERGARLGLALITDITERQRGEAALRESEERFRTLAENIPQLAWMADGDGAIFWYNQRWHNYTGMEARRASDWLEFLHPDHSERVKARLLQSFDSREEWEDIFPLRSRDGQYRWFLSRAMPIRNDRDVVVRWFGTSTDVTEQKHSESSLRRTNHDLQQFAYVASHDLREPLRNISNYAELLSRIYKDDSKSALRDECIKIVTGAAIRMNALIGALLAYARATGKDIAHEPVDISRVVDEAMTNLEAAILEAGAVITRDSLPTVRADQAQLVQVLQNLIGNSLKYRRPNVPPHIHVTAEARHDEWLFCVRDNGEGFKQEYSDRVFEIFKRLHGNEIPGAGIGLSICKAIVDRHGGRMWADAHPGAEAKFYFTLKRLPS